MAPQLVTQSDGAAALADAPAGEPGLLIDRQMPRYDVALAHAAIYRPPPAACYHAVREVDLFRHPVIRMLFDLRGLPQSLAGRLFRRRTVPTAGPRRRTFRINDLLQPPFNWLLLAEEPNVELVVGQIARVWEPAAAPLTVAPADFGAFDRPGFAKIVFGMRVQPYGATGTIFTAETRVVVTDPESLRRFRRYWTFVGPFSELIRRIALRQFAAELRRTVGHEPAGAADGGQHERRSQVDRRSGDGVPPLSLAERIATRLEHEVDTRSIGLAARLYRLTEGRIAWLWHRRVLLLTTRGRRSGRARTVPLQFFPDGERMVVVAANSGLRSPPAWYFNLTAEPRAC